MSNRDGAICAILNIEIVATLFTRCSYCIQGKLSYCKMCLILFAIHFSMVYLYIFLYKSESQDNFRVLSNWLWFTCSESGNLSRTHSECLAERIRNTFRKHPEHVMERALEHFRMCSRTCFSLGYFWAVLYVWCTLDENPKAYPNP